MSNTTLIMIVAVIFYNVLPSLKERIMPVKKLAISPAIFLYMLYRTITETFYLDTTGKGFLILGLAAGIVIGILLRTRTTVKADRGQELIWLPGTWINLITFTLIFSVHFIVGYLQSESPQLFQQANISEFALLFALTCVSSITIGANSCLYYKYLNTDKVINHSTQ